METIKVNNAPLKVIDGENTLDTFTSGTKSISFASAEWGAKAARLVVEAKTPVREPTRQAFLAEYRYQLNELRKLSFRND